jgi:hypothetical protein
VAEQTPTDTPAARSTVPEKVSAVAGALTAVAAFVVIPGSIAMLFRLKQAGLPDDLGVVVSLPHDFLIALGLGYVVGPLLIPVSLAVAVTWLPGQAGKITPAVAPGEGEDRHFVLLALFVVLITGGIPFAVFPIWPPLFAFGLSFLTALAFVGAAYVIARADPERGIAFGLLATTAALIFVAWAIAFAVIRNQFEPTTVCLSNGNELNGVFIGRTADEIFVGEPEDRASIVSGSSAFVNEKITQGLKASTVGVHPVQNTHALTFERTSLLIADVGAKPHDVDYPIRLDIPVLGYYTNHTGPPPKGTMESIEHDGGRVVPDETITDPQQLKGLISQVLDASHELFPNRIHPPRRIVAAPVSKVDGYRLGAAGPCPVRS